MALLVGGAALVRECTTDGVDHAVALALWIFWPLAMLGTSVLLDHPGGVGWEATRKRLRLALRLHVGGWILLATMIAVMFAARGA